MVVRTASLVRTSAGPLPVFKPLGEYRTRASDFDYVEEEWIAIGEDQAGRPYETQVFVRRPRDAARFSGLVIVESLHVHGIAPIYMYSSPYILRSGHGWACVASQKIALESHVKKANPERYATLKIGADPAPAGAPADLVTPPFRGYGSEARAAWWAELARYNAASPTILAQVGAAFRSNSGPFGADVAKMLLAGHSQTGFVATNYIREAHAALRRDGGAAIYDGFFPTGFPAAPFGPCDVPIVQVMSDGDIANPDFAFQPGYEGRQYRRKDSDAPQDRYRLYELACVPHMTTRYPPHTDPSIWGQVLTADEIPTDVTMNSLPHNELFDVCLDHLVRWVKGDVAPPRAERIAVAEDGFFAVDEHGASLGGVRCVQLDVPRATYHPNGVRRSDVGTVGTEEPFDPAKMRTLYGDPAAYVARFEARLNELIAQGWMLPEAADDMRAEARAQRF
jgi:hypothetical protein